MTVISNFSGSQQRGKINAQAQDSEETRRDSRGERRKILIFGASLASRVRVYFSSPLTLAEMRDYSQYGF